MKKMLCTLLVLMLLPVSANAMQPSQADNNLITIEEYLLENGYAMSKIDDIQVMTTKTRSAEMIDSIQVTRTNNGMKEIAILCPRMVTDIGTLSQVAAIPSLTRGSYPRTFEKADLSIIVTAYANQYNYQNDPVQHPNFWQPQGVDFKWTSSNNSVIATSITAQFSMKGTLYAYPECINTWNYRTAEVSTDYQYIAQSFKYAPAKSTTYARYQPIASNRAVVLWGDPFSGATVYIIADYEVNGIPYYNWQDALQVWIN